MTDKAYIRFFNKLESAGIAIEDYIMLIYCDNQGNLAKPRIKFGDFIKGNWLYKKYYECKYSEVPFTVKDLKINGKDLIGLGMKPGKDIGILLNDLFDEVMKGELKNFKPDLMMCAILRKAAREVAYDIDKDIIKKLADEMEDK